jgi:hypothetical protein
MLLSTRGSIFYLNKLILKASDDVLHKEPRIKHRNSQSRIIAQSRNDISYNEGGGIFLPWIYKQLEVTLLEASDVFILP